MSRTTAIGYVQLLCEVATREHGLDQASLLAAVALDPALLDDEAATVPEPTFLALLRLVRARTGDPALGLRLAQALDLRRQGFFGYALLSSGTVRERVAVHLRYQRLRGLVSLESTIEGDVLTFSCNTDNLPTDLLPIVLDFGIAGACLHHRQRIVREDTGLALWLSYREAPHHRALRALVGGPVVFDAPCNRLQMRASDLDQPLNGDAHLAKLAHDQLEAQLAALSTSVPGNLLHQVRERVLARLTRDPSLDAVAGDLRVSARTLRRHLAAQGVSYQTLLEQVRQDRATRYLRESGEPIEWIAGQLGYGDPSNFRRAFKRWTGLSPRAFRAREHAAPPATAEELS